MSCPHSWGPYHWYITSPGWTRVCKLCFEHDPPGREAGKYKDCLPLGGVVCQDCKPGKPCLPKEGRR